MFESIKGFNGEYLINKKGEIFSNKTKKILKGSIDSDGYTVMKLNKKIYKLHRLVAVQFIENPLDKPQVNHLDGNKRNNEVSNLEWVSAKENIKHAHQTKLATNNHLKKKIMQMDLDGNVIAIYDSYREASLTVGVLEQNISQICRKYKPKNRPKPRETAGGYKWKTCND